MDPPRDAYRWHPTPAPGTTFDARLKSVVYFGMMPNQTLTETCWQFNAAGQFIDSHTTFGSTSFSNLAVVPPDSYGTYTIGEHGVMTLSYASGKVVTGVASLTPNDNTGQTHWAVEGFIMGQENFYVPDDT